MKILYLLQSTRFSGAENVVCQIIRMMKKDPSIEAIYASPDGQIREALAERKITFEPLAKLSVKELRRVIKKYRPDAIHAHDRSACVIAALAAKKIPVIAHIHVNNNKGLSSLVKNILWTLCAPKYRHIFWVSDSAYDQFQFKKIIRKKSSVLYNVIDIKALNEKADSDTASYDYDLAYVGRLSYQKHPERLMKVLHEIVKNKPSVRVAIIGTGEYAEYVTNYIKENALENSIHYLGYSNNPLKLLRSTKAMIMTSRFEGTPMVALEAQCLGVPVVSTPVDGMKKVITNGHNGYLSDEDSELVQKTLEILSDNSAYQTLHQNSLQSAIEYNDLNAYRTAITNAYLKK